MDRIGDVCSRKVLSPTYQEEDERDIGIDGFGLWRFGSGFCFYLSGDSGIQLPRIYNNKNV